MLALTLYQPYATLIVQGYKTIETRSWGTTYRGPLTIHASRNKRDMRHIPRLLAAAGLDTLRLEYPISALLGTMELVNCLPTDAIDYDALPQQEKALGHFGWGRYAWMLSQPVAYPEPIPMRGARGLWTVSTDLAGRIVAGQPAAQEALL